MTASPASLVTHRIKPGTIISVYYHPNAATELDPRGEDFVGIVTEVRDDRYKVLFVYADHTDEIAWFSGGIDKTNLLIADTSDATADQRSDFLRNLTDRHRALFKGLLP